MFSLTQVKRIIQRVKEIDRQKLVHLEARKVKECGFNDEELKELRWAFDQLDLDGGGSLCEVEARKALSMLGVKLEKEIHFKIAFQTLDADGSNALEFLEFLKLLKAVRDHEGPLKPVISPVTTLDALDRSDF